MRGFEDAGIPQSSSPRILESSNPYRPPAARRRFTGDTVIVDERVEPQGFVTLSQYCVAAVVGSVMIDGPLPETGCVKSSSGPRYQLNVSDGPVVLAVMIAAMPSGTTWSAGCAIKGAVHIATTSIVTRDVLTVPQSFVARSQKAVFVEIGPVVTDEAAAPVD